MSVYGDKAEALFREGYNCAQAVLLAFEDVTGLNKETASAISSSFGGGLGRMREVCGAVSGAAMVLGIVKGNYPPEDHSKKSGHYKLIQEFARRFREENGSIICRELLEGVAVKPGPEAEERTTEYYKKRPCPELVACAAEMLGNMLGTD
jgi:C_GCAxxG_C_C family probable redox protein